MLQGSKENTGGGHGGEEVREGRGEGADKKRKLGRAWENEIRSRDLSGNATCNFNDT